jgi:hypothetical protein
MKTEEDEELLYTQQALYDECMWHYNQFKLLAPQCGIVVDLREEGLEEGLEDSKEDEAEAPAVQPGVPGCVAEVREYPDIFVGLETSSEDWLGFYASKRYHVIAVHALEDPASREVGRDHPGTHRVIQEAAAANVLMQRYVCSVCK